jgi:ornithine decarboxylase
MQSFSDVAQMLRALQPDRPVYCVYPRVYHASTRRFIDGFPGRVLYAVKANNEAPVLAALVAAGIRHFDCASLAEIEQARAAGETATCYFMNPVRLRGAAREAQRRFGVRHFVVDHAGGLAALLEEIEPGRAVIFVRMAVSHGTARVDLSSKFGAGRDETIALLRAVAEAGAEPALAFNVGSAVMSPAAFTHALALARGVLDELPWRLRLVDIGGGFAHPYPGLDVPELEEYFRAIREAPLPLAEGGELLAEPGRALSAPGLSAVVQVLLRKDEKLYINDGMYGAFWDLRFDVQDRFAARAWRDGAALEGAERSFRIFGPTCDSSDVLPGSVPLPADIDRGDYIEFGEIGAYSLGGRTDFNGFHSDTIVAIDSPGAAPPR